MVANDDAMGGEALVVVVVGVEVVKRWGGRK